MSAAGDHTQSALLDRLREGADPLAWDEFFRRYWRMIYGFAKHRGCSDHTAEEIVQEVMLKVFGQRSILRYDSQRGRFRDWLGTVVRNAVIDYRRKPSESVRGRGGAAAPGTELENEKSGPDALWEAQFEQSLLLVLLDVLRREMKPRDYLAFELLTLYELPGAQVAEFTGLSRNAVYKARRRALKRLRQLCGRYADEGQLTSRVKQALEAQPDASIERSLVTRIDHSMRSQ